MATLTLATAGTLGDHLPYVALGAALARRGHTVRLAGSPSQLDAAKRAGLETHPLRPDLSAERARPNARHWDHWSDRRGLPGTRVDARSYDLAGRYADLHAACAGADALVCASTIPWARLIHETTGLPWLTLSVTPYHFWRLAPKPPDPLREGRLAALLPAAPAEPGAGHVDYFELVYALRAELGLAPQPRSLRRRSIFAEQVVLMASPAFVAREELQNGDIRLTDFAFHADPEDAGFRPDPALEEFLRDGEPPVVLSFGSLPLADPAALLERHAEAARRAGVRLLVQGGWSELGRGAPSTPELHATGWLPQDWLFARAAAVIHHGGIGITARALRHGLPLLVEPFGNDQFWNARQVLAHGVGAALHPHRATPDDVARLLRERVLAAPTRERARALGRRLCAGPGVDAAADAVEAWLPRPRAARRPATRPATTPILVHDEAWGAPIAPDLALPPGFELTTDRSRLEDAAAVVFHLPMLRALPRKPAGQLWVAYSLECDLNHATQRDPELLARFDLSMTYHLDSDVPVPYLDCFASPDALVHELMAPPRESQRPGLAAAFISSPVDLSRRQAYVSELMRHMPVDSYGAWRRNRKLDPDRGRETKLAVIARYAFTLAFENAIAPDYVTEKFFDPLRVGSVPVYLGAPNVARFAPCDGCFIDASRFEPRDLARHLLALHADPAAYAELLAWKRRPLRPEFLALAAQVRENAWLRLCRELARRLRASGRPAENAPTRSR